MFSFYIGFSATNPVVTLVQNTDFTVSSSSSTGAPVITYTDSTILTSMTYNENLLLLSESYRRLYPVVRDKNTIKLTDGTHNITMSSTSSGYSIGQHIDTNIASPSNGQLLQYNGTSWVNSSNCTLTQLNFSNSGNTISLVAPTLSSSSNYFLPTTASPSAGLVLTCSGVLGT